MSISVNPTVGLLKNLPLCMMQAMPKPWMSLRIKLVAMKAALQEITHYLISMAMK